MKKNLKSLIAATAGSFLKKAALTIGVSLVALSSVDAQCTTNNLMINTGLDVGPSMTAPNFPDHFWKITTKSPAFNLGLPVTTVTAAEVVMPLTGWGSLGTSSWISDEQNHANPGIVVNPSTYPDASMTFGRNFCLEQSANVTFNLEILVDNYVSAIMVDGVIVPGAPSQTPTIHATLPSWIVPSFTIPLSAGSHTLEIVVVEDNVTWANPIGLNVTGSISTPSASIIDDLKEGCICNAPAPETCNDKCYWKVEGNSILNGHNIFGTTSNHSIDIRTNNTQRGVITNAGKMGWGTTSPTALFHVDCMDANGVQRNIRFEDLPQGEGHILVVDNSGYVYKTYTDVAGIIGGGGNGDYAEMKQEVRELKAQLAELRQTLAVSGTDKYNTLVENELYQNSPNPFGATTIIGYNIVNMQQNAFIAIYDMNGKELMKQAVTEKGKGSVTVSGDKLVPGMYMYSLIVDGKETATKRMVVTK